MQSPQRIALWFCLAAPLAGQSQTADTLRVSLLATAPADKIELRLSRPLAAGERIALIAGDTDVSAFLISAPQKVSLTPSAILLPAGELQMHAWLVTPAHEWRDAGAVKVKVKRATAAGPAESAGPQLPRFFTLQQNSSLQLRTQPLYNTTSRLAYRRTFQELSLESSLMGKFQGQGWHAELQSNVLGSSQERNALRYWQLGSSAPPVDLASYSAMFESRRVKAWVGDQSFGTSRQLLNSFNGRGVRLATNFGRIDLTIGLTSGTAVQGYDDLLGFEDGDNRMISATLGIELRKVPGAARIEFTGLHGTARQFFDNTEESSSGASARFAGNLWKQRLTWDAGVANSVADTGGRGAHYAELNFQPVRDRNLTQHLKTSWTATFREERVDPGYRSLGAFVEPDIARQQLDITGNIGPLLLTFDHNRSADNLAQTEFQWTTYIHQTSLYADLPLHDFLGVKKDRKKWLPHISYTYFGLRSFSTEPPKGVDPQDAGPLPDTRTVSHSVALDWGKRTRFGYRFSFDGQQNYGHFVHSATYAWSLPKKLDVAADAGIEESTQLTTHTWSERFSGRVKWRPDPRWQLSANFSGTRMRDSAAGSALLGSLDIQAQWRMLTENVERGRRVRAEWNARYSNRYALAENNGTPSLSKVQYFQAGLTFTFF